MTPASAFDLVDIQLPPARKINRTGQARHLSTEELSHLFAHIVDPKWRLVFALAYFTGSRISEVLSLTTEDITDEYVCIHLSKSKKDVKPRRYVMRQYIPALDPFLAAYDMPEDGYLFPSYRNSKRKTHVTRQASDKVLREAIAAADLDGVSTHSFRRSFATNLNRAGKTDNEIQRLLGHSDIKNTKRYIG